MMQYELLNGFLPLIKGEVRWGLDENNLPPTPSFIRRGRRRSKYGETYES
jgi:hypothetical protein